MADSLNPLHLAIAEKELAAVGGLAVFLSLMTDPAFAKRLRTHLAEEYMVCEALATYAADLMTVMQSCGFVSWNVDRITGKNFPGEKWEGGEYDFELRRLPPNSDCYNADDVDKIVALWMKADETILGSATAGDGIFFSREVRAGRLDQPNGIVFCPGSMSVDGALLYFSKVNIFREAALSSREDRWGNGDRVLLRRARAQSAVQEPLDAGDDCSGGCCSCC